MNKPLKYYHIWYSSEERALSSSKKIVYDDKGTFVFDANSKFFEFRGKNLVIKTNEIVSLDFGKQRFPWKSYLFLSKLTIVLMTFASGSFLYAFTMTAIGAIIGALFGWFASKWIIVKYYNNEGELKTAYFADGYVNGYAGVFGGTKSMYKEMVDQV